MIKKYILASAVSVVFLSGSIFANGHGTHTAGTIGATGNNGTATTGNNGRDLLVGGTGADRSGGVPTGTVTFRIDGNTMIILAMQLMAPIL